MPVNEPGTKSLPTTTKARGLLEAADAKRMYELRTGEGSPDGERWTLARIADEMGCSVFRVQKLLNKYVPKLLDKDASQHRDIEIGKLDVLEERLWSMIDEEYYTVSQGRVVYMESGDPVPDIEPVMKIIDRLLKVADRRAKLLGLDKPVRVEATIHQVDTVDMELARMLGQGV